MGAFTNIAVVLVLSAAVLDTWFNPSLFFAQAFDGQVVGCQVVREVTPGLLTQRDEVVLLIGYQTDGSQDRRSKMPAPEFLQNRNYRDLCPEGNPKRIWIDKRYPEVAYDALLSMAPSSAMFFGGCAVFFALYLERRERRIERARMSERANP